MKPLKEKISITVDGDVLARIKAEADKAGESINRFILEAIRQRIEK